MAFPDEGGQLLWRPLQSHLNPHPALVTHLANIYCMPRTVGQKGHSQLAGRDNRPQIAKTAPGGERALWGSSGRVRPEGFLEEVALGSGWKDEQDWLVLCPASMTRMTCGTG